MTPYPPECQAIIDAIRAEVPRPKELPRPTYDAHHGLGFGEDGRSPLGLLMWDCAEPRPSVGIRDFDPYAVAEFSLWWDWLDDPQAAVDAVWGPA
jgi:hypothetical protein